MSVALSSDKAASIFRRAVCLGGRNPTKRKSFVGKPEAAKAAKAAEGPGSGTTVKPASITAATTR